MDYQRDEHRVHLIVSHLIWCPKRRKPVLTGKIARDCQTLIEQRCAEHGWTVVQLALQPDHVHRFVRVWPPTSAAEVIKACKGRPSHELRKQYPVLRKMPSL
jgi:putative transposase